MAFKRVLIAYSLFILSSLCPPAQAEELLAVGTSFSQIFEQNAKGEYKIGRAHV